MSKLILNLENMHHVRGGVVALMFEKALQRAIVDLESAPDIGEGRKVSLTVEMKPVTEIIGQAVKLIDVDFAFTVSGKVPNRVAVARMNVRKDHKGQGQFVFESDAPDNPHQSSLLDEIDAA